MATRQTIEAGGIGQSARTFSGRRGTLVESFSSPGQMAVRLPEKVHKTVGIGRTTPKNFTVAYIGTVDSRNGN